MRVLADKGPMMKFPKFIIGGWIAMAVIGMVGWGMAFGWWLRQ